jgi:hypothetical protein
MVKFVRHTDKVRFITQRRKLREAQSKYPSVHINENLTYVRYQLLRKLIKLKDEGRIYSVWTLDGNLFYKKDDTSKSIKITNSASFNPDIDL